MQQQTSCVAISRFTSMSSLHGETFGFVVEDLLALPDDRPVLADDFRTLPAQVALRLARD